MYCRICYYYDVGVAVIVSVVVVCIIGVIILFMMVV